MSASDNLFDELIDCISEFPKAIVAFSGGTDSTLLLKAALEAMGTANVMAVTAISPLITEQEADNSRRLAHKLGAHHRMLEFNPLAEETIASNPPDRCFHCKSLLFNRLIELAHEEEYPVILEGSNVSDLADHRPGLAVLNIMEKVRSPFLQCGMDKKAIRLISEAAGLENWNQPSQACLASRIPYGNPLTLESLSAVARAENYLRQLGFVQVRVRHHGDLARIEVANEEISRLLNPDQKVSIIRAIKICGFKYVTIDMEGYRTGSLNEVLNTP